MHYFMFVLDNSGQVGQLSEVSNVSRVMFDLEETCFTF